MYNYTQNMAHNLKYFLSNFYMLAVELETVSSGYGSTRLLIIIT